jgi:hypothetical protein
VNNNFSAEVKVEETIDVFWQGRWWEDNW